MNNKRGKVRDRRVNLLDDLFEVKTFVPDLEKTFYDDQKGSRVMIIGPFDRKVTAMNKRKVKQIAKEEKRKVREVKRKNEFEKREMEKEVTEGIAEDEEVMEGIAEDEEVMEGNVS